MKDASLTGGAYDDIAKGLDTRRQNESAMRGTILWQNCSRSTVILWRRRIFVLS